MMRSTGNTSVSISPLIRKLFLNFVRKNLTHHCFPFQNFFFVRSQTGNAKEMVTVCRSEFSVKYKSLYTTQCSRNVVLFEDTTKETPGRDGHDETRRTTQKGKC